MDAVQSKHRQWLLVLTVCAGTILAPLNSTMIALALPTIRDEFNVSHGDVTWLAMTYLIAMVVMQPVGGRLGDQIGRSRVFRGGLALCLVASIAAAAAPNFPLLVLLRTVQAVIGAAIIPCGVAILRENVQPTALGRVTSIISSAASVTAAVSPVLGAGVLAVTSWRVIFLTNIPFVALGLVGFPLLRYGDSPRKPGPLGIDFIGMLGLAGVLVLITLLGSTVQSKSDSALPIFLGVALAVTVIVFLWRQFHTDAPVAEWRLFTNASFTGAGIHVFCNNLVMYAITLMIPFYIKEVRDQSSLTAGWLLLAMSGFMAVGAPVGGRLSDSMGRRLPVLAGGALMTVPTALLLLVLDADTSIAFIGLMLAVAGIGLGLGLGAAVAAAIETAPDALSGAAAGTNFMMRWLGAVVGTAVLGGVLTSGKDTPSLSAFSLIVAVILLGSVGATAAGLLIRAKGGARFRVWPFSHDPALPSSNEPVR